MWVGHNGILESLKLSANVCIFSYISFSIDALIFSTTVSKTPQIQTLHSPELRHPWVKVKDGKCHHPQAGPDGWIPHPLVVWGVRSPNRKMASLFPFSTAISALLLPILLLPEASSLLPAAEESGGRQPCITSWRWLF